MRYLAWLSSRPAVSYDINIMAQSKGHASCSTIVPLIWRVVTVWPCPSPDSRCWQAWGLWAIDPSAPNLLQPDCSGPLHGHLQAPPEQKTGSCVPPALRLGRVLSRNALTGFCFILPCKARAQEQSQWQRRSQLTRGETWSHWVPCECCCMRSCALPAAAP